MLPRLKVRVKYCDTKIKQLIRTVVDSRKEICREDLEKKYLKDLYPKDTISACCDEYGINISNHPEFISWPVFFGTSPEEINVCAVNFGALTLHERNRGDKSDSNIAKYVNAAINMLVVTSILEKKNDKFYRYWPTHIDYTNKLEAGTLNQTTLSLSTLLRLGFLDGQFLSEESQITHEQLLNRFKFVIQSINWIISLQETQPSVSGGWSYAEKARELYGQVEISTAILPSHFCYEVIRKYYQYFTATGVTASIVNDLDHTILNRMRSSFESFEKWITVEQRDDGGFRRNSNYNQSNFANSCCAMLLYAYDDAKDIDKLNALIEYARKNYNNFDFELKDVVDSYKYRFRVGSQAGYTEDAYEIFPEALFINNSIKAIEDNIIEQLQYMSARRIREINYIAFEKILNRIKTIEFEKTGTHEVIQGRQLLDREYPIYVLYYAKLCLEKMRDNDSLPYKTRKKYICIPLISVGKTIALTAILLTCVLCSYLIDATNTVTSIILGIASFIMPTIVKFYFGERKYTQKD